MRIKEFDEGYEISFDFDKRITLAIKKIMYICPGAYRDISRKSYIFPKEYAFQVHEFGTKYGFVFTKEHKKQDYTIPSMPELSQELPLKMNLYPYQRKGVAYNIIHKRTIIGDKMGLGKTCQAIASVLALNAFPCLVICPSSLKINWQREWHMWTDKKACILNNQNMYTWHLFAEGKSLFGDSVKNDVFIANYESLKKYFVQDIVSTPGKPIKLKDVVFTPNIKLFKSVIIDEAHRVKEPSSLQSKLTKGITTGKDVIFAITGTPVVNKVKDLASILAIINQVNNFGGYSSFVAEYGFNDNMEELNYKLNLNCFYSRNKKEVLSDLPDKIRTTVLCDIDNRTEYSAALADLATYLREYRSATDQQVARSMRGEIMVRIGVLKNISARGKLNAVKDYIYDLLESGEKLVVFIHQKEVCGYLTQAFPQAVTITGDDDMTSRQRNIDSFQNDPKTKLIICSIKAAGVGLTLTASSNVAFVELPWTAADTDQCEDRCIVEGEKVLTPDGWKKIETIQKGDIVINMYGENAIVNDAWSRENTKLVTEIKVEGWGELKTTNNHQYLTKRGWIEAGCLIPGDRLLMPFSLKNVDDVDQVCFDSDCRISDTFIGNHGQTIKNGRLKHAPEYVELTKETLFMFGYFIGDGFASTQTNKGRFISVAGNKNKKMTSIDRCKEWFEAQNIKHHTRESENGIEVRGFHGEWSMFFKKHFGANTYSKQIPEFLMNLNQKQSSELLEGLMASDGYYRRGRYEYVTVSEKLAPQVARIIINSGFRPTVNKNSTGCYVIGYSVSQKDMSALVQSVYTHFPKNINGRRQRVYDITTDHTESFVIGMSVVHNCHRISQKDTVNCVYFLGRNTIDEDIYQLIQDKREVSNIVTGGVDESIKNEATIDELINKLKG